MVVFVALLAMTAVIRRSSPICTSRCTTPIEVSPRHRLLQGELGVVVLLPCI
jgi:hypothetical protein